MVPAILSGISWELGRCRSLCKYCKIFLWIRFPFYEGNVSIKIQNKNIGHLKLIVIVLTTLFEIWQSKYSIFILKTSRTKPISLTSVGHWTFYA